jgi:branched-chain amino acid transport system permease protein
MENTMLSSFLTFLILGLLIAGIYALFSIGLTLLFGVMDIINVAHGEMFTVGAYLAFCGIGLLFLPPIVALGGVIVGSLVVGLGLYLLTIRPLHSRLGRRPRGPVYLVLTLGMSILLQNIMLAIAGGNYKIVPPYVSGTVNFLNVVFVSRYRVFIFIIAVIALVALFLFLKYTKTGLAIRAVKENPNAAQAVGIKSDNVYMITFGLVGLLAGLSGALLAPISRIFPSVGALFNLKAFAIIILGGMGNLVGALIGSIVIGISETMAVMFISSDWKDLVSFALMVIILIVRPSGIMKGA